jgi:D-aspartate ligase
MVPVVVVNGGLNALGVIRSVARGRVPIYLVSTTRRDAAAWSRYCRFERFSTLKGYDLVCGLKDLSRRVGQRPVLMLTCDTEVATISTFREELAPFFRLSLPSKEMVHTLADKTLFQNFAEQKGFPVPRAVTICEPLDLSLLRSLTFPVVIKPNDKSLVLDGKVPRAVRSDTLESAHAAASHMLNCAKRLLVQEWIDGADSDIFFTLFTCDSNSRPMAMFSGRKLVCDPPSVGTTAICVEAPEVADELERITTHFISRTGYQGIGSLEFKRDRKDGRFVIVEPTVGRTDWQEEIATLCGINIPLMTYLTEIGQSIKDASCERAAVVWRASIGYQISPETLPQKARTFDGYFRLDDALPGIYHYVIDGFVGRICGLSRRFLRFPANTNVAAVPQSAARPSRL